MNWLPYDITPGYREPSRRWRVIAGFVFLLLPLLGYVDQIGR